MPGILLRIAVSITVEPTAASTVRAAPLESLNVIFGIRKESRTTGLTRFYIAIRAQAPTRQ
jgi:hypothetical protein